MYNVEHHTTATTINLLSFAFWRYSSCTLVVLLLLDHFVRWCVLLSAGWSLLVPFVLSVGFVIASIDRYTISYTNSNMWPLIAHTRALAHAHMKSFLHSIFECLYFIYICCELFTCMTTTNSIDQYLIVYTRWCVRFTQYVWFLILDYNSIGIIIFECVCVFERTCVCGCL